MGGAGFGQGLVQGLEQAQNRQLQFQELKLRQDHAKALQKSMEAEDQMKQLQLQSLQRKIEAETRLPSMQANLLGPEGAALGADQQGPEVPQGPAVIDRRKLASFLQAAGQAGQDPDQLLSLMAVADPRIEKIRQSLQPEKFTKLGEGEELVSERTGVVMATGKPKKEPHKALNATEAEVIGDFATTYPDKMTVVQQALGHIPSLNDIGQHFTPQEFSAVMKARQLREEGSRIRVAQETGANAAKTAAESRRKEPILEEAGKFFRFNPQTGLIDGISDPLMSKEDVAKAGYRQVAATHADKIERFNDIEFDLKQRIGRLKELASVIITASGGMNAWRQGAQLNFDALLRSGQMTSMVDPTTGKALTVGEATQLYKSQVDTIREPYARSVNGLKGTATDRDILSAGRAFTALSETTAINAAKFQEIEDRLDDVKRSAIASIFGAQAVRGQKPKQLTGAEADTDFLSMLTPEAKQKYLKKTPEEQSKYRRFYLDKMQKAIQPQ